MDRPVEEDVFERLLAGASSTPSPAPLPTAAPAPAPSPAPEAAAGGAPYYGPPPYGQVPYGHGPTAAPQPQPHWAPSLVAPRKRRMGLVVGSVLASVVLVAAGIAAYVVTRPEWDPRIKPLVAFVEQARGGEFERPVAVEFHAPEDYDTLWEGEGTTDPDPEAVASEAHWVGTMRALGFLSGDLDMEDAYESVTDTTLGHYSFEEKRIHVRGEVMDVAMRVTLVHELTHAFDVQKFDLAEEEFATTGEDFAYRAVLEGSAMLIENEYIESLTTLDQEEYYATQDEQFAGAESSLESVPWVISESFGMPYAFGPAFIESVSHRIDAIDIGAAIDYVFGRLPTTEEHLARPDRYLADDKVTEVAAPALRDGEKDNDTSSDMGQVSLALVLAPHVGAEQAWRAVDGWAGDNMTGYSTTVDGKEVDCARVAVAFDYPEQAAVFGGAAAAWARAIPGATSVVDGTKVDLAACDPGPGGPAIGAPTPSVSDMATLPTSYVNGFMATGGVGLKQATCVYDRVVAGAGGPTSLLLKSYAEAEAPEGGSAESELVLLAVAATQECGVS